MGGTNSNVNNTLQLFLKGLNTSTNSVITENDRVIDAFGKLQAQIVSGTNIINVDVYSNLPTPSISNTGKFYWVENDEGTWWLPGSLGDTYYKKGLYYNTGTTWETAPIPYQATQIEVNAGTEPYKFVTSKTLKDSTQWVTKFDVPIGDNTQYLDGAGVPTIFPSVYTKNETDTLLINKLTNNSTIDGGLIF